MVYETYVDEQKQESDEKRLSALSIRVKFLSIEKKSDFVEPQIVRYTL